MTKAIKQTSINFIVLLLLIAASGVYPEQFDVTTEATCKSSLDSSLSDATKTNICKGIQLRSLAKTGCTGRLSNGRCKPQDSEGLTTIAHTSKLSSPGRITANDMKAIIPSGSYNSCGALAGSNYRVYTVNGKISISKKDSSSKWQALCTLVNNAGTCSASLNGSKFTLRPTISGLVIAEKKLPQCTSTYYMPGPDTTVCLSSTNPSSPENTLVLWKN